MEKWADYLISKVSYDNANIDKVIVRKDNGDTVGEENELSRNSVIRYFQNGRTFATITRNTNNSWIKLYSVSYRKTYGFDIISIDPTSSKDNLGNIPLHQTKRNSFISYYHKDDEVYRNQFESLTNDIIINKSVGAGEIDSDNSADYIKQLIQDGYLDDASVLIVLIGTKTKFRKHVDYLVH
jgi:antiphage defense system Thoeris ThsB-like protein